MRNIPSTLEARKSPVRERGSGAKPPPRAVRNGPIACRKGNVLAIPSEKRLRGGMAASEFRSLRIGRPYFGHTPSHGIAWLSTPSPIAYQEDLAA